ncbi:MAG: hypothetical protein CMA11_06035 [Euryarchaeota archaeon]|nr:hypothetical protein [Euryarchaeota archaeon]
MLFAPITSALDGDGDGYDDSIDICPFAAGSANSTAGMGCPDSDGDGLADFEQTIMHNWGESIRENTDYSSTGSGVRGMAWATNGTQFYAGGGNEAVQVFDSMGNHLAHLYQMPGDINEISVSPDGTMLAVASDDGGCRIINSTTGSLVVDLINTSSDIFAIAWSNDGNRVITHAGGSAVRWFETTNWAMEQNITSLPGWVSGIDTTPDDRLVVFSSDNNLRAYWSNNGTIALNMSNHTEYIRTVTISPDGRYIASGSNDNSVIITDIATQTVVATIWAGSDVYDLEFSPDGGTLVAARGRQATMYAYRTDTWSSLGEMEGFGSSNNNRGVYSISFDSEGEKLAIGWRRGYVSIQMASDAYIRVHGLHYTSLMESPWRSSYLTLDEAVRVWDYDRVTSTLDVCDSKHYIGSSTNGVSPQYATKHANYSTNGLWDCKNTPGQILEVAYGRAAGALMVKAGGQTETCLQSIGGLSMGQVRWITSSYGRSVLTSSGGLPAVNWSSVVPNDDADGVPEWKDLDSSCQDTEIVLSHRWENKTDTTILEETVLCANCAQTDSLYSSSSARYRAIAGEFRSDVTQGVTASGGEGSIAFTELAFTLNNNNGLYIVPLVDNFTHGAADAIADGGVAIDPSINASRNDIWPLQTDMRAFVSTDHIAENTNFLQYLLTDMGQLKWEQMGFIGLNAWGLYSSWQKLGVDMSHLLPDADSDGIWDGDDSCPDTDLGLPANEYGCAENQLNNDGDSYFNDLDDCDDEWGNSTLDRIGCPDYDGDGWSDAADTHPADINEWNDTDSDLIGDNSDDCIDEYGNSTEDLLGCIDTDGDGWSDQGDAFFEDKTEWVDSDGDGVGDNADAFPFEVTQWLDTDNDEFGDNNSGLEGDDCIDVFGTSFEDGLFGCIDSDGDGWADSIDDLPDNPEQYRDEDGDGVGDDATFGDYDDCPDTPANETANSQGCSISQRDTDLDGFYDDEDRCINTPFTSALNVNTTRYLDQDETIRNPYLGCANSEIDADGDNVYSHLDWDDNNPEQWLDSDGDGYGDNSDALYGDDCPTQKGTSTKDKYGCFDLDGDGWSYSSDFNDGDATQWNDTDEDGFGDNWANPEWNESRTIGQFIIGATQPDRCPDEYSVFLYSNTQGCLKAEVVDENKDTTSSGADKDEGSNFVLILGIAGAGIVLILVGAIATIMRKKPQPKPRKKQIPVHPALEGPKDEPVEQVVESQEDTDQTNTVVNNITYNISDSAISGDISVDLEQVNSESVVNFVSTWEELPSGEWLPTDDNGVNWYLDNNGTHWYSDDGGFRIWEQ